VPAQTRQLRVVNRMIDELALTCTSSSRPEIPLGGTWPPHCWPAIRRPTTRAFAYS